MRVEVDNARSHGKAADIEYTIGVSIDPSDVLNAAVIDRDIAKERRHARAIVNAPAFED
jgi:hypothetical protein